VFSNAFMPRDLPQPTLMWFLLNCLVVPTDEVTESVLQIFCCLSFLVGSSNASLSIFHLPSGRCRVVVCLP
jgi:hypothetical protein